MNAAAQEGAGDVIPVEAAVTLDGLFRERVRRTPDLVAYRYFDEASNEWRGYTWREMDAHVARWQAALERDGLKAGDRVAIMLRNSPEWVMCDIAALGRRRGIPVLVDGAHTFAHFPFRAADLDCDYFASSLHKWLCAPHGTGLLYVRREKIRSLWPLMAAATEMDDNIRKFEEIGTHPAANTLAIAEALTFHQGIGPAVKAARLRYLRDRWAKRLAANGRIRLHTSLKEGFACALATVQIEGVDSIKLSEHLWGAHRILVTPIKHEEFEGLRVTPHVYTTLEEIDRFADAMERVTRDGLPKS